ncbi:2-oxoacid:acceptor oxidoreductase subunit alpha [Herbivorax sp. ANBcel31]|uniref:2-oxoacid:acceptor oxidoreductase subunit alpha n=1 Tax=Herbivorax sp. ANBcel31 TaxID=3069754 RepID=UPI0027B873E3|nr:2-oxoacid:acceptor oxidoreductase subunit alpha [Herbivorax sp. ANBcel31]MDQ2086806.1 2-oxoacid:acceptor oxidoreductase subunit alpha [Herbivorax sp. ANBcel31]
MDYNILVGGMAGQGMDTITSIIEKALKRMGLEIFTIRDYMSRVRGGHNFTQIRFGEEKITSHRDKLNGIIAFNDETISNHIERLEKEGFIIADESIEYTDKRLLKLPLMKKAKEIGNFKVFGSVAVGALFKLYNLDISFLEKVLEDTFKKEVASQNIKAIRAGNNLVDSIYYINASKEDDKMLINGNDAIALGVIAAGCKFYSAYPMTPSTSIMNYLAGKMEEAKIVVEQAEDEIAAINMAIGASYAGTRAMTGTSGGGFSLMVEALGLSGIQEIPLVIAEIQRPGPATGFPTRTEQSDLKFVISASHGEFPRMVIALKNPEDCFYQTMRAFNIADKYRMPVIILGDQFLADYTTTIKPFNVNKVELKRHFNHKEYMDGKEYKTYEITQNGISPRIIPGKIKGSRVLVDSDEHDEYGRITESPEVRINMSDKRLKKMEILKEELIEPSFYGEDEPEFLLLGWGSLEGPLKEAIQLLNTNGNTKYGALVFGDIWPLPLKMLNKMCKNIKKVINVEQNATGQLASLVREETGIKCEHSILKYDGRPISSEEIYNKLREVN